MTHRLRVVGFIVQARLMVDDGTNLTDLPVDPVQIPAAQWPNVVQLMEGAVAEVADKVGATAGAPAELPDEPPSELLTPGG